MKKNSASTILMVLAVIATLSACVIAALNYTMTLSRNVQRTSALRTATEIGDGALEYAFANWREICRVQPGHQYLSQDFASPNIISLPTQAMFPGIPNFTASTGANPATGTPFTIANFGVAAVDPEMIVYPGATVAPPGAGTNTSINAYYYLATADVSVPGFGGKPIQAKVRRVFAKQQQSPWSYAIFYNDLLEINPGANMTIAGWVHTNGNLYTEMSDLTFANKVDYGGDWSNGTSWAPGDSDHPPAAPAAPKWAAGQPPARGPVQEPFGIDTATINAKNALNGLPSQTDAQVYSQLIASGANNPDFGSNSYYNQAAVRVLVDNNNNITIKNANDATLISTTTTTGGRNPVTTTTISASPATDPVTGASNALPSDTAVYNTFTAAVSTGTTIQDNRQNQSVRLVTIDMSVVTAAINPAPTSGSHPAYAGSLTNAGFNGIIYASDTSGSATVNRGVRLKNGAIMPSKSGITVASNNGVYIQGDYNTGQTSTSKTPANSSNNGTGKNIVPGYTEQSCAVLGDAVMILSNAYTDGASPNGTAKPTTVNTAIVSGIVPTSSAYSGATSYSGGAENFPRFLENWGGQYFTYYGSMVELFQSQQFTGRWGKDNVYSPPTRNWNFDTLFYTSPPPGSLILYSFVQNRWFVQ